MTSLEAAFNPRSNSLGFVRWLMAFMVIFSHAGPIAGFYGGHDLGTQWSDEQSFGGVAVCGFFFLSGFLITRSKMGRTSTLRYFWHRVLRIYPGFFLMLLVTAFVLAPIAWMVEKGSWDGFWNASSQSPFTYFSSNFTLILQQTNIADMGGSTIMATGHGLKDWNGSAWTLAFEFGAYIMVAALGVCGALANRVVGGIVAFGIIALSTLQWLGVAGIWTVYPGFTEYRLLLLLAPFAWGMIFQLFKDKVPIDDRLAIACIVIAAVTYAKGGWLVFGQFAFAYALLWFAIRVQFLRNWDKRGDLSYGIYISGWPIMWFATFFHLQNAGWLVYHLVVVVGCHVYAFISWHLIEKPAMSLKKWTPRWYLWLDDRMRPGRERLFEPLSRRMMVTGPEVRS